MSTEKLKTNGSGKCPVMHGSLTKFAYPSKLEGIEQKAVIKIFESCVKYPVLFGGSESVNSILTKSSGKKVLVKNGADGVYSNCSS